MARAALQSAIGPPGQGIREPNAIVKIFTVAAVIFLPPTLVAIIYGMNFEAIPEIHWKFGHPYSIGLMVISVLLPWFYCRRKGWL